MNFLYGTYGFDILSIFLLIVGALLNLGQYTRIIGNALVLIVLFRGLSKNTSKRSAELSKFTSIANKILGKFGKSLPTYLPKITMESIPQAFTQLKYSIQQKRKFKIVKCPKCHQKLRLPRGQKRIIVTCKRCSNEFKMRT